jgi:hypothetical protein
MAASFALAPAPSNKLRAPFYSGRLFDYHLGGAVAPTHNLSVLF